ncbi:MAG: hypothetical protein KDD02_09525 [Phaeodactylibacter sp.]|nr:hypothetical protein [Phaeodactylibacter sp.]MCB9300116.1 hypothetical protein [Lewinellaceae bacterium]HQU58366.1 hypothetical protein [Saprospiraceae bacterium]
MNEQFVRSKYEQLEAEMAPHIKLMGKAADAIIDQDISSYPIFVIHQFDLEIGILILERKEKGPNWSINVTTLEELATKKVVEMAKVDSFRQVYKDPRAFLCLFVLSDLGANFIFLPRDEQ